MKRTILFGLIACAVTLIGNENAVAQVTFEYSGEIENYVVPENVATISIQAYGAQGGGDHGGLGASIYGEFAVTVGDTLKVVVGGQGTLNSCGGSNASGGGGGGSFVYDPNDVAAPWVAAGGGGGANHNWNDLPMCTYGIPGQAGMNGTSGAEGDAMGGVDGHGGAGDAPSGTGAGGGGWLSAGQDSAYDNTSTGGQTYPTFQGGDAGTQFIPGGEGGFGGGGSAVCGCGGGGGYSGGAGGNGSTCRAGGGGGGSYNAGLNPVNLDSVQMGNGQVIITVLTTIISVEEFTSLENARLYPNPVDQELNISCEGHFDYTIMDMSGRVVMRGEGNSQELIDSSEIQSGVYLVQLQAREDLRTLRFIKN